MDIPQLRAAISSGLYVEETAPGFGITGFSDYNKPGYTSQYWRLKDDPQGKQPGFFTVAPITGGGERLPFYEGMQGNETSPFEYGDFVAIKSAPPKYSDSGDGWSQDMNWTPGFAGAVANLAPLVIAVGAGAAFAGATTAGSLGEYFAAEGVAGSSVAADAGYSYYGAGLSETAAGISTSSASFFSPTGPDLLTAFNPGNQMITETLAADIAAGTYAVPSVVPELVLAQSAGVSGTFASSILDVLKNAKTATDAIKAVTALGTGVTASNQARTGLTLPSGYGNTSPSYSGAALPDSKVASQSPSEYSQITESINIPVIVAGVGLIAMLLYFRSKKHG